MLLLDAEMDVYVTLGYIIGGVASFAIIFFLIHYAIVFALKSIKQDADAQKRLMIRLLQQQGVSKEEIEEILSGGGR